MKNFSSSDWVIFFSALGTLATILIGGTIRIMLAINEIHIAVNSRMDEIVELTRRLALTEGRDKERQDRTDKDASE